MRIFFWIFCVKISIPFSSMRVRWIIKICIPLSFSLFGYLLIIKLLVILFNPVLLVHLLFTSKYQSCNIFFFSKTLSLYCSPNVWHKSHTHTKMDFDQSCEALFGWEVHVAGVQSSPCPMCTTSILFCKYVLPVTLCAVVKQLDWYATWYIGLFFDMSFSTFLIPLIQCPIMTYNLHDIHIYTKPFIQF